MAPRFLIWFISTNIPTVLANFLGIHNPVFSKNIGRDCGNTIGIFVIGCISYDGVVKVICWWSCDWLVQALAYDMFLSFYTKVIIFSIACNLVLAANQDTTNRSVVTGNLANAAVVASQMAKKLRPQTNIFC